VWPVFLFGKINIDVFGSPFAEGGTTGNQWSDTDEVANSLRVKGRDFFSGRIFVKFWIFFSNLWNFNVLWAF
jgi:hypothetical protein